jgi:hypothetical protein
MKSLQQLFSRVPGHSNEIGRAEGAMSSLGRCSVAIDP